MPRREKKIKCSKCGYTWSPNELQPIKTWHMVSPMPDKQGRITVTVLGIWICPNCGYKVRGTVSKLKLGEDTGKTVDRTTMLIEELNRHDRISLKELSKKFKFSEETIKMAVEYLINKGLVKGRIVGNDFVKGN
ncbi:MAG: hypothetical protein DRZ80_02610 [Thermoprotei archaeon]|nr:MAG: hypothetical protein DRZ80_02610 [Thermoprotei archaeon]